MELWGECARVWMVYVNLACFLFPIITTFMTTPFCSFYDKSKPESDCGSNNKVTFHGTL